MCWRWFAPQGAVAVAEAVQPEHAHAGLFPSTQCFRDAHKTEAGVCPLSAPRCPEEMLCHFSVDKLNAVGFVLFCFILVWFGVVYFIKQCHLLEPVPARDIYGCCSDPAASMSTIAAFPSVNVHCSLPFWLLS